MNYNNIDDGLEELDLLNKEMIASISNLHIKLLPESIPSKLGSEFLEKFYLSLLKKHNLINGFAYKLNGEYVGFLLFTKYPYNFINKGIFKNPFIFLLTITKNFIKHPFLIVTFLKKFNVTKSTNNQKLNKKIGQFLTFGVLEEFLSYKDLKGEKITNALYNKMIERFNKNAFIEIIGKVNKNNKPAIFFHRFKGNSLTSKCEKDENYDLSIKLVSGQNVE